MNFSKFVIKLLLIPTYITSTMNPIIYGIHPSDHVFYKKKESILLLLEQAIRYGDINTILELIKDSHLSINTQNAKKKDLREPVKAKPKAKKEEDQYNDREKEEDEETPEPEQKARFIPNDNKPRGKPKKRKRK
jgi:hypothetical protein